MHSERLKGSVLEHALRSAEEIDRRLAKLAIERDLGQVLEAAASVLSLAGLFLGIFGRRRYLLVPAGVLWLLYVESTEGRSPASAFLERLGLRRREEILQEIYALKALRGDFNDLADGAEPGARAVSALRAIEFE